MKKVSAILISVFLVIMSVPSISSRADGGSIFRAITSDIFEDQYGSEALGWVSPQFSRSESYFDDFSAQDYSFLNDASNYPVDPTSDRVVYSFGGFNAAKGNMQIVLLDFSEVSGDLTTVFTNVNGITVAVNDTSVQSPSITGYYLNYSPYSHSFIQNSTFTVTGSIASAAHLVLAFPQGDDPNPDQSGKQRVAVESLNDNYTFYNYSSSYLSYMFYTNCAHYFTSNQFWDSYTSTDSTVASQISNNFGALNLFSSMCTDYLDGGFSSYFDGVGVVTPDRPTNEETNANHMYFNSCEVGFCEPSGVNNFSTFGGAYFYTKYSVDQWVKDHINDYDLYFSATAFVGSRQYNGSVQVSLDPDGCISIPFSDIFTTDGGVISNGFVAATTNKLIEQRFYKTFLYSVSGDNLEPLLDKFNNVSNNNLQSAWDQLLDISYGNWLLTYNATGMTKVLNDSTAAIIAPVAQAYTNFKIQTIVHLVDKDNNISGNVGRVFDLYTGSDTSTDNQGLTNEDPYIDDNVGDDEDYLPDVPSDNQVVGYGTTSNSINQVVSVPSEFTLKYRDGVNSFIDWYNQDPSSTGIMNSFWGMMGVFRNNPATDIYEDYWGFLPSGFKNLVLACASLGIIGFAATVLRKRLMR